MIEPWLLMFVMILVRVGTCLAFLPAPFGRGVPSTVKIGLAVAISYFCTCSLNPASAILAWKYVSSASGWIWLSYLTARETALGFSIAWLAGLVIVPARLAGAYLAQEIGLSLGSMTSPLDQAPSNVIGNILDGFTTILILGLNLHYVWIWTIRSSLHALPVGSEWMLLSPELVTQRLVHAEQLGLASIGSLVVLMCRLLVVILVTSRLSPQTNLFSFGMPFRSLVGCAGLLLFLPEILLSLKRAAELLLTTPGGWQ